MSTKDQVKLFLDHLSINVKSNNKKKVQFNYFEWAHVVLGSLLSKTV